MQVQMNIFRVIHSAVRCGAPQHACHPEPAETARDPSCDDKVTLTTDHSVGNPDANHPDPRRQNLCDQGFGWEVPERLLCFGMTAKKRS
jgi:hypothetical protein